MAKAKKLPSGNWRALVYSHTDPLTNKRKYESFTAETKKEAEFLAAEYARSQNEKSPIINLTLGIIIDRYISSKENILSPSTIRGYLRARKNMFPGLLDIQLKNLNHERIQMAVNSVAIKKSTKTIKNWHGLLSSALKMFYPSFHLNTTFPEKKTVNRPIPTDAEVKKLLKYAEGKSIEIAILLASLGSLRRSEIPVLTSDDVTDFGIVINKAVVRDNNNNLITKGTKTAAGERMVPLPPEVLKKLKDINGILVPMTPEKIYSEYKKCLVACKLPDFRFHDLRHYYASVLHALGVPDKYIMQYGGWKTDIMLKNVYQHVLSDREEKERSKVIDFIGTITEEKKNAT